MTLITSTNKFQRTYTMQIQGIDGTIYNVGSENGGSLLTLEFSVKRDVLASAQSGTFRIRNLNPSVRSQIYKDWFDTGRLPTVIVKAGYLGTPLSTIFNGIALSITSYREEGGTDFITEIEGQDYSLVMSNSFSNWTIGDNNNPVNQEDVINRLIGDLKLTAQKYGKTLATGIVGGFLANRYTYTANDYTWNLLQVETNRLSYIDNGKIYCLPNNYVFEGDVNLVSSETGLLGSPRRYQSNLIAEMIFEPSIIPGQQIYLDTNLDKSFNSSKNGTYKVTGVQHAGVISSAVSGKCKTLITMQIIGTPFVASFGL